MVAGNGVYGKPVAARSAEWAADPKRWRLLAVAQVAGFMSLPDISIVNVVLPSIEHGLAGWAKTVQWVVSGYALTGRPAGWAT